MPADESVARSGATVRQDEWRAELLRAGIRGKGGQMIHFSRVEPLSGTRWLHADAETKPNDKGPSKLNDSGAASEAQRAVISFGQEHAPLEQRQVESALEEARKLVPKPKLIVFAAFQFDPEAAKDIDELNWPGVTVLKAQMNADLLTEDLKKKRTSWRDPEQRESKRFFFCQLEAIETLIWLTESPASERVGISIPSDGGAFPRVCSKLATGTGKTIVMAMVVAWQVLNKVTYPQDDGYAKHVFVVAPGLTVKNRLQVLYPSDSANYYDEFNIVPAGLRDQLRHGKVLVRNWHVLNWETDEKVKKRRSVDKRGAKSDEAYVREVLGEMASVRNIVVINDEAHHAWRVNPESKKAKIDRQLKKQRSGLADWIGFTRRGAFSAASIFPRRRSRPAARRVPKKPCSAGLSAISV